VNCLWVEPRGFAVTDPGDIQQILPDARLERVLAANNRALDYLREIAVMLEAAQERDRASTVIEKARASPERRGYPEDPAAHRAQAGPAGRGGGVAVMPGPLIARR